MRKCVNPDCGEICEDRVNPCLKCGWTTIPYEDIEKKKPKKDVNVTGHGN